MSEALAINTKWTVRDFGTHLELRGDVGQYVSFENIGDLLECMDWLERHFGHVREQRPTKDALDDGDSVASSGIVQASALSGSQALSQPAPSPVI